MNSEHHAEALLEQLSDCVYDTLSPSFGEIELSRVKISLLCSEERFLLRAPFGISVSDREQRQETGLLLVCV